MARRYSKFQQLDQSIQRHITQSMSEFDRLFKWSDGNFYTIKYLPPKWLASFATSRQLYASDVPGYTWGDGVYVAPISTPFTSMMFGRAGIVGRINPTRVYDASGGPGTALYQEWIQYQWRWYDLLTTTIHSEYANRYLRNRFRTMYQIDCVFFRPDQASPGYVGPMTDYWMALTHWQGSGSRHRVAAGNSNCVLDAEWCVVCCEEFASQKLNIIYQPLLGPALRGTTFTRTQIQAMSPNLANNVVSIYQARRSNPGAPVLVITF